MRLVSSLKTGREGEEQGCCIGRCRGCEKRYTDFHPWLDPLAWGSPPWPSIRIYQTWGAFTNPYALAMSQTCYIKGSVNGIQALGFVGQGWGTCSTIPTLTGDSSAPLRATSVTECPPATRQQARYSTWYHRCLPQLRTC